MKNMKKYFIFSFILFLIVFYLLIKYYKKQVLINNIIKEWKNQTNGNVVKDTGGYFWKNDYYLMFDNTNNYDSHIHLKIYNNDFWVNNNIFKMFDLEYTPKKDNKYPLEFTDNIEVIKLYTVNENIPSSQIVKQMIEKYKSI